jgi:hypothetical protein
MSKIKATLFIFLGAMVHFGLTIALVLNGISCEMRPNCVSAANKVGAAILGFPLDVIMSILYPHGTRTYGWFYILMLLNSFAAVIIIWFVLIRPFVRRRSGSI